MFRCWEKKLNRFAKESKQLSRKIESSCKKCSNKKKLRKIHQEYIDFVESMENTIFETHYNLEQYFDDEVST